MVLIRNQSGVTASLHEVNAVAIADGATIDLRAIVPATGLPLNASADIQGSAELEDAISSAAWAVVESGVNLSPADGLKRITGSSVSQAETSNGLTVTEAPALVTPNPAHRAWFDVAVISIAEGEAVLVDISVGITVGTAADMRVASTRFVFMARRRTGAGGEAPRFPSGTQSEQGVKFEVEGRATGVAVRARRNGTEPVYQTLICSVTRGAIT